MSTVYTGVAAHVNLANPVAVTVPADGDPDNAATFDAGMQALADYNEALRGTAYGWASLTSTGGSTALTTAPVKLPFASADSGGAAPATASTVNSNFTINRAGKYKLMLLGYSNYSVATLAGVNFWKNGVALTTPANTLFVQTATASADVTMALIVITALAVGDVIDSRATANPSATIGPFISITCEYLSP